MGVPFTKLSFLQQERLQGNSICSFNRTDGLFCSICGSQQTNNTSLELKNTAMRAVSPSVAINRHCGCRTRVPENCIVRKIIKKYSWQKKELKKKNRKKDTDRSSSVSDGSSCNSPSTEGQNKLWLRPCPNSVDSVKAIALLFFFLLLILLLLEIDCAD